MRGTRPTEAPVLIEQGSHRWVRCGGGNRFERKGDSLDYRYFQGAETMMLWAPGQRPSTNIKAP